MRSGFVTLVGRPNVGKSHAGERDVRAEGEHRQRQAADHPHAGPRHPHPTRTRSSCSSTRPVCTSQSPLSASGSTPPALDSVNDVDVVCLVIDATKPFGKGDHGWRAPRRRRTRSSSSTRSIREQGPGDRPARAAPSSSARRTTSRCRQRPARASRRWSPTSRH